MEKPKPQFGSKPSFKRQLIFLKISYLESKLIISTFETRCLRNISHDHNLGAWPTPKIGKNVSLWWKETSKLGSNKMKGWNFEWL
jgi:hypothetical protein